MKGADSIEWVAAEKKEVKNMFTAKKTPSGGLVRHSIEHDCPMLCQTSLSDMGSDNSV
jgi:hypothetical protein